MLSAFINVKDRPGELLTLGSLFLRTPVLTVVTTIYISFLCWDRRDGMVV